MEHFDILAFTDEPAAAAGLSRVLPASGRFRLTAVHDDLADLGCAMSALKPLLLLLDLTPSITLRVILDLREKAPHSRIVLWVRTIPPQLARLVAQHGVCGILRKSVPVPVFFKCLEVVAQGGLWFEGALQEAGNGPELISLSRREQQLVGLVTSGLKNKEIAAEMDISEGTVKVCLNRLFRKLGVGSRTELTIRALRNAPGADERIDPALSYLRGWPLHACGFAVTATEA